MVFIFYFFFFIFFLYRIASTWAAKYIEEMRDHERRWIVSHTCTQRDDATKAIKQKNNSYCKFLHLKVSMCFVQCYVMNTIDKSIGILYLQYKQCLLDFLHFLKKMSSWHAVVFFLWRLELIKLSHKIKSARKRNDAVSYSRHRNQDSQDNNKHLK